MTAHAVPTALVWFRRDLRSFDHAALSHALQENQRVYCVFVFDTTLLNALPSRADRRVDFILASALQLHEALRQCGGAGLIMLHGDPNVEIPRLAAQLNVSHVYANRDYEPQALARDAAVETALRAIGIQFTTSKDQVIFEKSEVLTQAGSPFGVFTAYKNAWLRRLTDSDLQPWPVEPFADRLAAPPERYHALTLTDLGFIPSNLADLRLPCGMKGGKALWQDFTERIDHYQTARDFPAVKGVSYLSTHLRFGTVSIRELARFARNHDSVGASTWLSELIWREFYQQILFHHPQVVARAWKPDYEALQWEVGEEAEHAFQAWCAGKTGYPIVDAAMRQLNETGYMHNRLRMIAASFLTKDLGIHWLRGERYFANTLNDYDLAANNGGWQWSASTGCDAQPWFRIFNPVTQSKRFDPEGHFIRRYVSELANVPSAAIHAPWTMRPIDQKAANCVIGRDYPSPIVDHNVARQKTLLRFQQIAKAGPGTSEI